MIKMNVLVSVAVILAIVYVRDITAQEQCKQEVIKKGCVRSTKPLQMLVNDRDVNSLYHQKGHVLNWNSLKESIHSLICRCYNKAKLEGYRFIAVEFFGECYGTNEDLFKDDTLEDECVNAELKTCNTSSANQCVGTADTEFVYQLEEDINGNYSSWSNWTTCTATCGGRGRMTREKLCNNPPRSGNGIDCEGSSIEVKKCNQRKCRKLRNLALYKNVTSSSVFPDGMSVPSGAVDGNIDNNHFHGHCMSTNKEQNPWIKIDLGKEYIVEKVIVYNRMDCCSKRISNFLVTVGNDVDGNRNQLCWGHGNMKNVSKQLIQCQVPLTGRYVYLQVPTKVNLNLCEMKVIGHNVMDNLALKKNVISSSELNKMTSASGAVDGVTNNGMLKYDGHCMSTVIENNPWLRIDLGRQYFIDEVKIFNRMDCCSYRLSNIIVTVSNSHNRAGEKMCGRYGETHGVKNVKIECESTLRGRYVYISLQGVTVLNLCEVQVFGYRTNEM